MGKGAVLLKCRGFWLQEETEEAPEEEEEEKPKITVSTSAPRCPVLPFIDDMFENLEGKCFFFGLILYFKFLLNECI